MTTDFLTHRFVRLALAAVALALVVTTTVSAQQAATYEVVSSFNVSFLNGVVFSSLRQADDGTLFGTAGVGGRFRQGVLFQLDAAGVFTTPHHFSGAHDGAVPFGLVKALNGRFYGMTRGSLPTTPGGAVGDRTIFRFTPGSALTTLHVFSGTDASPIDLFAASDGNVYGLTSGGGDFDNGTIFVIDPGGGVRTIHSFPLSAGTGMSSLIKGGDGRFFVTAEGGGAAGFGSIFAIDDAGTVTILHSFAGRGQGDGEGPRGLMQSRDGRLFGTTRRGGDGSDYFGTVYSIGPTGDDYRVLHTIFTADPNRGSLLPDLLEASDGNVYGVDSAALFRIDSSGTLTLLHGLVYPGNGAPLALIQGADGRLYGTLNTSIFTRDANGTLTTLYQATEVGGVGRPNGVIQARDGQFYGTTGFAPFNGRTGSVFRMDAAGARTTLYALQTGTALSNLFEDADGSLYGTTFTSPAYNPGQIFTISPAGDFTSLAALHELRAGVVRARDGRLYFTRSGGPTSADYGGVSRIDANGAVTTLHDFNGSDGVNAVAELVEIDDGTLYGTTSSDIGPHGTIFRVDPATGSFTTVYCFTGPDGSRPLGRLIQGSDGLIYGTASEGGAYGFGTVFSLDAAGTLTTLHHFAGPDGTNPNAGVIQGLDGRLYGTTSYGGASGHGNVTLPSGFGTVFVMNVTGGLATLHDFALSDGANPLNELIQASDGAFYGAASLGGPGGDGVIFRVRLATSPPDQYVEIVSRHSGQCLDVSGGSTDAAASVIQWTCHGGPNQQWRLEPAGGGAFRIIARHSGQALDVYGALLDDVVPIIQWPMHGGDNQVWTLEPASDGYVLIVARHSGKAMDVEFASADEGARVIQYLPHGGANQQWLLRAVP